MDRIHAGRDPILANVSLQFHIVHEENRWERESEHRKLPFSSHFPPSWRGGGGEGGWGCSFFIDEPSCLEWVVPHMDRIHARKDPILPMSRKYLHPVLHSPETCHCCCCRFPHVTGCCPAMQYQTFHGLVWAVLVHVAVVVFCTWVIPFRCPTWKSIHRIRLRGSGISQLKSVSLILPVGLCPLLSASYKRRHRRRPHRMSPWCCSYCPCHSCLCRHHQNYSGQNYRLCARFRSAHVRPHLVDVSE